MSNFIISHGLGGNLVVTHGYGDEGALIPYDPEIITDYVARSINLFIEQFKQLREVGPEDYTPISEIVVVPPTPVPPDIDPDGVIIDYVNRGLNLFIEQFKQKREL